MQYVDKMENEKTQTEDREKNLAEKEPFEKAFTEKRSWKKYLLFLFGGGLLIMLIISLTPEASAPNFFNSINQSFINLRGNGMIFNNSIDYIKIDIIPRRNISLVTY